jgi:hypothetical protein
VAIALGIPRCQLQGTGSSSSSSVHQKAQRAEGIFAIIDSSDMGGRAPGFSEATVFPSYIILPTLPTVSTALHFFVMDAASHH